MGCDHGVSYDDFYDIWNADQNTKLYKNEILRYNHLLNLVPDSVSSIFDVGCGTGYMSYMLAKRDIKITALDLSQERLNSFKSVAEQHDIKQISASFYDQNFNEFDAVISQEVLEHLDDYQSALEKMNSFVKPNGYGIFCVPFNENLAGKTKTCEMCGESYHINGHVHSFTKASLATAVTNAGFTMLQQKLFVNKRTTKWMVKSKSEFKKSTIRFDNFMNTLFPHKAAYLAVLCQKK